MRGGEKKKKRKVTELEKVLQHTPPPSWSLKPLEERSLSSGFSPPAELKRQQEATKLAVSKDFPGGTGTMGRSWEGGFHPSLVKPWHLAGL